MTVVSAYNAFGAKRRGGTDVRTAGFVRHIASYTMMCCSLIPLRYTLYMYVKSKRLSRRSYECSKGRHQFEIRMRVRGRDDRRTRRKTRRPDAPLVPVPPE